MKLSDYVFEYLANLGITHVFGIVGGANSHLADSLVKNKSIKLICTQHEQAAAMAAEGYTKIKGIPGVTLVTSGPGGTNAITGLCGAWCDSTPCFFVSGQLPLNLTADGRTIRQLGVQQINIMDAVKPYAKYAVMVTDPGEIRYHLEKAFYLAREGRPGPVWLDIPTDIQRAEIEPDKLNRFSSLELNPGSASPDQPLAEAIDKTAELIAACRRPVVIAGQGIRLAGAQEEFLNLANRLGFPVVTTWNGIDLIDHGHRLYLGSAGVMGQRGTNFAVANSDLIISIGSRLDTRQVGNSPNLYARAAKKVVVDIDKHELNKELIHIDLAIKADAKDFIVELLAKLPDSEVPNVSVWLKKCRQWQEKYPIVPRTYSTEKNRINSYIFVDELCRRLKDTDIVVTDMGTSLTCTMQTFRVRGRQRLITNTGLAPMGFGLPGAIGAWFGGNGRRIIGIFGDGGFQMNIQELQTVVHYRIPMKIFVLNNRSYLTIKHTQEFFFNGVYAGAEPTSGYSAPSFHKIARAYGINAKLVEYPAKLEPQLTKVLERPESTLCEIMMDENQELVPLSILDKSRGYAGSPIERMYPFLSEEEHLANMVIPAV